MMYRRKVDNKLPDYLIVDAEKNSATEAHRLYVQVRMEGDSPVYSTYVLYGFESFKANRVAFICRKYEQEIGVGVGLRGNHRAAIGQGYYTDDICLGRPVLQGEYPKKARDYCRTPWFQTQTHVHSISTEAAYCPRWISQLL